MQLVGFIIRVNIFFDPEQLVGPPTVHIVPLQNLKMHILYLGNPTPYVCACYQSPATMNACGSCVDSSADMIFSILVQLILVFKRSCPFSHKYFVCTN